MLIRTDFIAITAGVWSLAEGRDTFGHWSEEFFPKTLPVAYRRSSSGGHVGKAWK
jgi:hypothetical protein